MNALANAYGQSAQTWTELLWHASLVGGLCIAVAWAASTWCSFLSARVVCWLWRLACLKMLVMLLWFQPVELALLPARSDAAVRAAALSETNSATSSASGVLKAESPAEAGSSSRTHSEWTMLAGLLFSGWMVGVGVSMLATARQWLAARRLRRASEISASRALHELLAAEGARLAVRRLPRLRLSTEIESPLLVGIWQPTILLPAHVEEQYGQIELRLMLTHELTHRVRRDLIWNWLPTVAGWLFFFHPLIWLMRRGWSEAVEAACDELILERQAAEPVAYGRLLLKLAARSPVDPLAIPVAAGVLGGYRQLERRILAMARVRPFSRRRLALAAGAVLIVAPLTMIPWRLVAAEPKKAEAKPAAEPEITGTYIANRTQPLPADIDPETARAFKRLGELGAAPVSYSKGEISVGIQTGWKGSDADLELLAKLSKLHWAYFDFDAVSAAAVGKLKLKQPLDNLAISGLTDERIASIEHLPEAAKLMMLQNSLSAVGVERFCSLARGVEQLDFANQPLNAAGLRAIGSISGLKSLHVYGEEIAGSDLSALANVDKLEELWLADCKGIQAADYARLAAVKSLRKLWALVMSVDAEGLRALSKLDQLEVLRCDVAGNLKPGDVDPLKSLTHLKSLTVVTMRADDPSAQSTFGNALLATAGQMPALEQLTLHNIRTDMAGLERLAHAPHLEELSLGRVTFDDRNLTLLQGLKQLKKLSLSGAGPVKAAELAGLAQLTSLMLSGSELDDDGLSQLASLHGLERLVLPNSKITGAGLKSLTHLERLETLSLSHSPFDDAGSDFLRQFAALTWLDLSSTKITDRSLDAIAALPRLRSVLLSNTSVTADGLLKLRGLKELSRIEVVGLKGSAEEIARLKAAMPDVQVFDISRDDWQPLRSAD